MILRHDAVRFASPFLLQRAPHEICVFTAQTHLAQRGEMRLAVAVSAESCMQQRLETDRRSSASGHCFFCLEGLAERRELS